MKEITKTVFITKDNKEFLSEKEARAHEEKIDRQKSFLVRYAPDLTETGNLTKTGYVLVEANWSHELWAEDFCCKEFGSSVAFVQGSAPTKNWTLQKIPNDQVESEKILSCIIR